MAQFYISWKPVSIGFAGTAVIHARMVLVTNVCDLFIRGMCLQHVLDSYNAEVMRYLERIVGQASSSRGSV